MQDSQPVLDLLSASPTSDLTIEAEVRADEEPPIPETRQKIKISNILWPLFLSLSVLVVISYYTFDLGTFKQLLQQLNPWFLLAAVGTVVARVAFGALRLNYLSHGLLNFRESVRSQLAWDFFGAVTPSSVGGGPFIVVFISKDRGISLGDSTAIILFSTLLEMLWQAFLIPTIVVLSFYFDVFPAAMGTVGFSAMMVAFLIYVGWVSLLAYSTLINPRFLAVLVGTAFKLPFLRRFRTRALRTMGEMRSRSELLRSETPMYYVKGFLISLVPWLSRYALPMFLIWSVYPAVDKLLVFLRAAALQLGALFMPTPGGAGAVEGLYLLFFGPPIMPQSLVAPTLLVWRLLSYYLFIFVGIYITIQFVQRKVTSRSAEPATARVPTDS